MALGKDSGAGTRLSSGHVPLTQPFPSLSGEGDPSTSSWVNICLPHFFALSSPLSLFSGLYLVSLPFFHHLFLPSFFPLPDFQTELTLSHPFPPEN